MFSAFNSLMVSTTFQQNPTARVRSKSNISIKHSHSNKEVISDRISGQILIIPNHFWGNCGNKVRHPLDLILPKSLKEILPVSSVAASWAERLSLQLRWLWNSHKTQLHFASLGDSDISKLRFNNTTINNPEKMLIKLHRHQQTLINYAKSFFLNLIGFSTSHLETSDGAEGHRRQRGGRLSGSHPGSKKQRQVRLHVQTKGSTTSSLGVGRFLLLQFLTCTYMDPWSLWPTIHLSISYIHTVQFTSDCLNTKETHGNTWNT